VGVAQTASASFAALNQTTVRAPCAFFLTMNLSFLEPSKSPYLLKNHLLCVPAEWMIVPEVSQSIEETKPMVKKFLNDIDYRNKAKPSDFSLWSHITEHLPSVYSIPLFTDNFCKVVMDEIGHIKETNGFTVNDKEKKEVQIEEFILSEKSPGWYYAMWQLIGAKINIIFSTLFNRIVDEGVIQLANYNPKEIAMTSWHHDGKADITMVVPLNTGEYEGGGTEFWNKGEVDPLPNGHALIFPTFSNLHRGLPLKSGDRYLFVFWLKEDTEDDPKQHAK
jgi:hypothetical protein